LDQKEGENRRTAKNKTTTKKSASLQSVNRERGLKPKRNGVMGAGLQKLKRVEFLSPIHRERAGRGTAARIGKREKLGEN